VLQWELCPVGGLGGEVVGRVDERVGVGYDLDAAEVVGHPGAQPLRRLFPTARDK
jgi:hypothetical protein